LAVLPTTGANGTTITWNSANPAISTTGAVTRPPSGADNASGTLTATIQKGDAIDTATFEITVLALDEPTTYNFYISAETGGRITTGTNGQYAKGAVISIAASPNSNYRFTGWTSSNGGSFADASSADTIFTMPANDVVITAEFAPGTSVNHNFQTYLHTTQTYYSPGDTILVDVMLQGDINFTLAETKIAYDMELLEYAGYENLSGWMSQVSRGDPNLVTLRNVPHINMNTGAPCITPVKLITLKFKVKDMQPANLTETAIFFETTHVYSTPEFAETTTAPGEALTLTLHK
jgi:uncharacterized repeat protein (TIGR02543 family)